MTSEVTTSQASGNTIPSAPVFRARSFLLTLNECEKYDGLRNELTKLKSLTYLVSAKETAPTTGHEHIHIYAHFESNYKLSKKILSFGAHVDICRGSPKQCIDYVKKDGNILDEIGTEPQQGKSHTVQELQEISDPEELDWKEFNTWKAIRARPQKIKAGEWKKEVKVYYIWGPSGIGKSNMIEDIIAKENIEEFEEVKHIGEFWQGVVDGNGACVYDDWRDSHMKASEFINFIDYRIHNMNIKGGSVKNKYNVIIISTVQDPNMIYSSLYGEPRKQWMRRMNIIDMNKNEYANTNESI